MKKYFALFAAVAMASCGGAPTEDTAQPAGPPVEISARDLSAKYAENEVAAKQEFDGKTLVVSGKIDSIELDFSDKPTVMMPGHEDFTSVHIGFTDEAQTKTAALKKGQDLVVTCTEISEVMGSPMLDGCTF